MSSSLTVSEAMLALARVEVLKDEEQHLQSSET